MMSHEDLDDQIRAALDVEPSAEQLVRLERFWMKRSRAETWRRRAWRVAGVAAAIVVVAAVSLWQYQQSRSSAECHIPDAAGTLPAAPIAKLESGSEAPDAALAKDASLDHDSPSAGRSPTVHEQLIFAVRRRDSAAVQSPAIAATVDQLIEQFARDPQTNARQIISTTGLAADELETVLLRRLLRSTDDKRLAVLRLLEVCGSSRSTPALLRISRRDAFRDAALVTIERIVGIERLAQIVGQTSDAGVRAAIARRLLTADFESGLRGYLSLVESYDTRALALAVADGLSEPPVAKLLACLDDEVAAVRLSAAVVLGHLNGPEITRSLVNRVMQNPAATAEAWVALLACRGDYAEEFLSYAARQPQLLVHVNSARIRWARIVN